MRLGSGLTKRKLPSAVHRSCGRAVPRPGLISGAAAFVCLEDSFEEAKIEYLVRGMHAEVAGGVFYIAAFLPAFPIYGTILDRDEQSAFDKASKGDRVVQISTLDRYQTNPISLLQEICSKEPSKFPVILEHPLIHQLSRYTTNPRREVPSP